MGQIKIGNQLVTPAIKSTVVEPLNVTPTTSAQTIIPSSTDGFSPVNVSAVTASIDSNITAGNIKKDVTILGVTGTLGGNDFVILDREVSNNGVYQMPTTSFTFSLPSDVTDIGNYGMQYAFTGCTGLTSVDLSSLTTMSGQNAMYDAFQGCTGLTSLDLSSLTTVSGYQGMSYAFSSCKNLTSIDLSSLITISNYRGMFEAFRGCTSLTSIDLSSLTIVSGEEGMYYALQGCTGLTSLDLSSLTTISGYNGMYSAFRGCTGLTSVNLSSLTTISGRYALRDALTGCTSLTSLSFPALTSTFNVPSSGTTYKDQFDSMLSGVTGCTVHFPSNLQSVIGSWSSVTGGFGGTNTTVLFDLPATT